MATDLQKNSQADRMQYRDQVVEIAGTVRCQGVGVESLANAMHSPQAFIIEKIAYSRDELTMLVAKVRGDNAEAKLCRKCSPLPANQGDGTERPLFRSVRRGHLRKWTP